MFEVGCSFAPVPRSTTRKEEEEEQERRTEASKRFPTSIELRVPAWALIGIGVRLSQLGGNQKLSRAARRKIEEMSQKLSLRLWAGKSLSGKLLPGLWIVIRKSTGLCISLDRGDILH